MRASLTALLATYAAVTSAAVDDVLAPVRVADAGNSMVLNATTSAVATNGKKACDFEGVHIRHRGAKYLVGRTHKRGSIYGSCVDGQLTCYEDNGIADAPLLAHKAVECNSQVINARRRKLGVAVELTEDIWPDGVIWYRINSSFSAEENRIIREGIALYDATDVNITFKECEPATLCNNKYVSFEQNEDACYSYVGYVDDGEPQIVNLGESCFDGAGTAVHEIGHALGLYHEHTHPQREVIVLTDGDLPVSASNYAKETQAIFKPYDKGSIMHYGRSAGLCLPKDEYPLSSFCDVEITTNCVMPVRQHCNTTRNHEIGQRGVLSAGDINTLKTLYGSTDGKNNSSEPVPIPDAGSWSDSDSESGSSSGSSSSSSSSAATTPLPSTATPTPPTFVPVTASPSPSPSPIETLTEAPTETPTEAPTDTPTEAPTLAPSTTPEPSTAVPTVVPSEESSSQPDEPTPSSTTSTPATVAPVTRAPAVTASPALTQAPSYPVYPTPSASGSSYIPGGVHGESSYDGTGSGYNGWWPVNVFNNIRKQVTDWTDNVAREYNSAAARNQAKQAEKAKQKVENANTKKTTSYGNNGWGTWGSYTNGFSFRGAGN